MTIIEGKDYLRQHVAQGVTCPCCGQYVKLWRHSLNSAIARTLIRMHALHSTQPWVHIMNDIGYTTMYGIAEFWRVIEPKQKDPDDDKRASGFWRLTPTGQRYVRDEVKLPAYLYVFNNEVIDRSEEVRGIQDALGKKFSYRELMEVR